MIDKIKKELKDIIVSSNDLTDTNKKDYLYQIEKMDRDEMREFLSKLISSSKRSEEQLKAEYNNLLKLEKDAREVFVSAKREAEDQIFEKKKTIQLGKDQEEIRSLENDLRNNL